jgi:RHS repeat-associated protein
MSHRRALVLASSQLWLLFTLSTSHLTAQSGPDAINGLDITPDGGSAMPVLQGSSTTYTFWAHNGGSTAGTYTFTCTKTGGVVCGSVVPASATIAAGSGREVDVTFTAPTTGTAKITLTATPSGETGFVNITVVAEGAPVIALRNHNRDNIDRSQCLTAGAGESAAWSCGDLVVSHAMPAYRTLGRDRTLTLLHNSATAYPRPVVAAVVTQPTGRAQPNTVYAELEVGGAVQASATYTGWAPGSGGARQVVLDFNGALLATGAYPMQFRARNQYAGGTYQVVVNDTVLVVNRFFGEFSAGFSLAGLEQLIFNQPVGTGLGHILWVGGDGSAKLYRKVNATTWAAPLGAYQDTLTLSGATYTRTLRHGTRVQFDTTGLHKATISRTGQTTTFTWLQTANGPRLQSITVPPAGQGLNYTFGWDGSGNLDYIRDPGNRTLDVSIAAGRMTPLVDPDGYQTELGWDADRRIVWRKNRRGFTTKYVYSGGNANGSRITRVTYPIGLQPSDTAATVFEPWNDKGLATGATGQIAVDTAQAYTRILGPRPNVADDASFWVDQWGAPTKVVDAIGAVTTVLRGDATVPSLVTQVVYPNAAGTLPGRVVKMTYNGRANLTQVRDSTSHLGTAGQPTKSRRYSYGSPNTKDSPSQVLDSVGSTVRRDSITYTSLGLANDVVDRRGHQTIFGYTTGAIIGLVNSVTEKKVQTWVDSAGFTSDTSFALLDLVQQFAFDAKGNLKTATSPGKVVTSYATDAFGRVTDVYDPLGFRQSWAFDPMNRVTTATRFTAKTAHPGGVLPLANCRRSFLFCGDFTGDVNPSFGASVAVQYNYGPTDLESIVDGRNVTRTFIYDPRGLVTEERDGYQTPNTRRTTYDAAGNVISRAWGVDAFVTNTVTNVYDVAGRLTAVGYRDGPYGSEGTVPADTVRYTYDQIGNLLTVTNLKGSIVRSYYGDGSVKSRKNNSTFTDSLFFTYDQSGARTLMSHNANGVTDAVTYNYSAVNGDLQNYAVNWGAPANVTRTVTFLWDSLGRRRQVTYPNNTVVKYRYDGSGILRRVVSSNPTNVAGTGDRLDFTFRADSIDASGRSLRHRISCPGYLSPDVVLGYACGASLALNTGNRYNRFGKLVYQNAGVPDSFDFDASDNLVFKRTGSQTPHWFRISTKSDRVITDSLAGSLSGVVPFFKYDSAGGRTFDSTTTSLLKVYYYDGMGRASGIRDTGHNGFNRHNCIGYDADGNIQSPCDDIGNWLQYDGANVVGASAVRYWSFVHGPGLDDPLIGLYRNSRTNPTAYTEWYWVTDGQGRQLATSAPDGQLGSIPPTEYSDNGGSYAGGTQNASTFKADRFGSSVLPGLSFFRNRVYDQQTGRWTQEDPLGVAAGLNLYQFNGNNPVMYTDPFGLCPQGDTACELYKAGMQVLGFLTGALDGGVRGGAIGTVIEPGGGTVVGAAVGAAIEGVAAAQLAGAAADATWISAKPAQMARAGKGRGGNQRPNADVRRIANEKNLNPAGRRELHDRITGQNMSADEIAAEAADVAQHEKWVNPPPAP